MFISYRRSTSAFMARAVFMDLRANGWDAFMDVESINAGEFESIILRQIEARAHFIVILSPGAVERCAEPGDWLRREIEHAIDHRRNVVPLLIGGFRFADNSRYLTGKLAELQRYNAINVPHDYFDEAMVRLRERYLTQPVEGQVAATPAADAPIVQRKVEQAAQAGAPTEKQLSAEEIHRQAYARYEQGDYAGAQAGFSQAIDLNPDFSEAYNMRGYMRRLQDDLQGALEDYNASIRADPDNEYAYVNRGLALRMLGDVDGAIADYTQAIRLDPADVMAYHNRGYAYNLQKNYRAAERDLTEALKLDPDYASSYWARGYARYWLEDWAGALKDLERYMVLGDPEQFDEDHQARVEGYIREARQKLGGRGR